MKKTLLTAAIVMTLAGLGFIAYAFAHPEASFRWSAQTTNIFVGLYICINVLLYVLVSFVGKTVQPLYWIGLCFTLAGVFFLVQSILFVSSARETNWYLPAALGLNLIGSILNMIQQKREKKAKEA